jgi:hypothetical protein
MADVDAVYRFDLDKTYLQTDFHTARGLLQAAIEGAHRKRTVPGMKALLKALSDSREARVVVVSGSPQILRRRILRMFALHGVRCDRLVLKDFAAHLRRGRLRAIKNQVPYKLHAHLETRAWLAAREEDVGEICFGDDAEVDALVYCLYADVCARRVSAARLVRLLEMCGAYPDDVSAILGRVQVLPKHDPVRRVYIHLDQASPPARFGAYRGRVAATFNGWQIALDLQRQGLCGDAIGVAVVDELVADWQLGGEALAGLLEDAVRRGLCGRSLAVRIAEDVLPKTSAFDTGWSLAYAGRVVQRLPEDRPGSQAGEPVALPYEQLFAGEQAFAKARKLALKAMEKVPGLSEFLGGSDDD